MAYAIKRVTVAQIAEFMVVLFLITGFTSQQKIIAQMWRIVHSYYLPQKPRVADGVPNIGIID